MKKRRKSDKTINANLIITILIALINIMVVYIVFPMKSDLNKRIDTLETRMESRISDFGVKLEISQTKFMNYYMDCKEEINDVRKEYQKDISGKWEQVLIWFKNNDKKGG